MLLFIMQTGPCGSQMETVKNSGKQVRQFGIKKHYSFPKLLGSSIQTIFYFCSGTCWIDTPPLLVSLMGEPVDQIRNDRKTAA